MPHATNDNDTTSYQPLIFDPASEGDMAALSALTQSNSSITVYDTLETQMQELVKSSHPRETLDDAGFAQAQRELIGHDGLERYGRWVFYPWSNRLVRTLSPADHFFLRCNRNQHKISAEQQRVLRTKVVGVVGLSVGKASAVTLAMEGVGGTFRLADFDELSVSNMNRLNSGLHNVGVLKTIITAREIFEFDPFVKIELFSCGVTPENIETFFSAHGKLDLLVEECDDLAAKIRLRQTARELRVPVVMETSDRGMVDIERFDTEPARPLLHGLVGDLRAEDLVGLTTRQKAPYVLKIIDAARISPGLAASLIEVNETLSTWPQLASSIAVGGGLVADVGRRILLDQLQSSGRYYVDLDELIRDGNAVEFPAPPRQSIQVPANPVRLPPMPSQVQGSIGADEIRYMVTYGTLAPSGGNAQPWHFEAQRNELICSFDATRSTSYLDYKKFASYLAMGAAVENIVIAAGTIGLAAFIDFVGPTDDLRVARIRFERDARVQSDVAMLEDIVARTTNRKLTEREAISEHCKHALHDAANTRRAQLLLTDAPEHLQRMGETLGACDKLRFYSQVMHRELMSELRWDLPHTHSTRTGIDLPSLELPPGDDAVMNVLSRWEVIDTVKRVGSGRGLETAARKSMAASSALGMLRIAGHGERAYFEGGRALQQVWLAATRHKLAFQPYSPLVYLLARAEDGGVGLDGDEMAALKKMRTSCEHVFPKDHASTDLLIFRLAHAGPPTSKALRLPIDDVLRVHRGAFMAD